MTVNENQKVDVHVDVLVKQAVNFKLNKLTINYKLSTINFINHTFSLY